MKRSNCLFHRFFSLLAFAALVSLSGCYGGRAVTKSDAGDKPKPDIEINAGSGVQDLTYYISQLPGVRVSGSGPDASVIVRGISTLNADPSPLFVINGIPLTNSYAQVYASVNVDMVTSVNVLKTATETSIYGMRGAAGVIEINTK